MKKATQKEIVYNENKEKLYYHKEQSRPEKFIAPMNDLVEEVYIELESEETCTAIEPAFPALSRIN